MVVHVEDEDGQSQEQITENAADVIVEIRRKAKNEFLPRSSIENRNECADEVPIEAFVFECFAMVKSDRFVVSSNLCVKKTKISFGNILLEDRSRNQGNENLIHDRPEKKIDEDRQWTVITGDLPRAIRVKSDGEW